MASQAARSLSTSAAKAVDRLQQPTNAATATKAVDPGLVMSDDYRYHSSFPLACDFYAPVSPRAPWKLNADAIVGRLEQLRTRVARAPPAQAADRLLRKPGHAVTLR